MYVFKASLGTKLSVLWQQLRPGIGRSKRELRTGKETLCCCSNTSRNHPNRPSGRFLGNLSHAMAPSVCMWGSGFCSRYPLVPVASAPSLSSPNVSGKQRGSTAPMTPRNRVIEENQKTSIKIPCPTKGITSAGIGRDPFGGKYS